MCADLLDKLPFLLVFGVQLVELLAPNISQPAALVGTHQTPHLVVLDALHEEVTDPKSVEEVTCALLLCAMILLEIQEVIDVRMPWLKVHSKGAIAPPRVVYNAQCRCVVVVFLHIQVIDRPRVMHTVDARDGLPGNAFVTHNIGICLPIATDLDAILSQACDVHPNAPEHVADILIHLGVCHGNVYIPVANGQSSCKRHTMQNILHGGRACRNGVRSNALFAILIITCKVRQRLELSGITDPAHKHRTPRAILIKPRTNALGLEKVGCEELHPRRCARQTKVVSVVENATRHHKHAVKHIKVTRVGHIRECCFVLGKAHKVIIRVE